jgi:nucleotide-binding universal stress UspA family protein
MNYITVGVDGSQASARALEWAAAEAARTGSALRIVHAMDLPDVTGIYSPAKISPLGVAELTKFSRRLLRAAAHRVENIAPGVRVDTRSATGAASAVLVHQSHESDAVVVGSRGLGAFEGLLGSVSTKVAARAECPVFVIPDHGGPERASGPIVAAVDDSDSGVDALRYALKEALVRNTPVRAVIAYELPIVSVPVYPGVTSSFEQDGQDQAAAVLQKAIDQARTTDTDRVPVESVVVEGPAVEAILANARDAQLIVVGSRRHGVFQQLLLGSTSRLLLHRTDLPVAVVHHRA